MKTVEELQQEGYDKVYVWDAVPGEEDEDHSHAFDTHLVVLEGEIEIKLNGTSVVLRAGDEIDIPREKVHYGKAGSSGCKYIVAEKH